jgi:hypothetical protein
VHEEEKEDIREQDEIFSTGRTSPVRHTSKKKWTHHEENGNFQDENISVGKEQVQ